MPDPTAPTLLTVSARLPGLLGPAGWQALAGGPVLALPGAAATAAVLREAGVDVRDVAALADATDGDVVLLTAEEAGDAPVTDILGEVTVKTGRKWTYIYGPDGTLIAEVRNDSAALVIAALQG